MRPVLMLGLALVLSIGCGKAKHPTAPVSGLVTYKNKPLTKGRVVFTHDAGHYAFGDIDKEGRYKLEAPVGECRVAVSLREDPPENLPPEKIVPGAYNTKSLIPEKYEDHMRSGLKFTIKEGGNTADWKLE